MRENHIEKFNPNCFFLSRFSHQSDEKVASKIIPHVDAGSRPLKSKARLPVLETHGLGKLRKEVSLLTRKNGEQLEERLQATALIPGKSM